MANKKLKVELEVDSTKAKRALRRDISSIEGEDGIDKASESIKKLGTAAHETQISMARVSRAFIGIGAGLAASYASSHLAQGSTARTALEYGGAALQGASMGAMVGGHWGAVAGGAAGVAKTYIDRDGEQTKRTEDFEKSEQIYKDAKAWQEEFKKLGEAMDPKAIEEILTDLKAREEELAEKVRRHLAAREYDKAEETKRELSVVRQEKEQAEGLKDRLDKTISFRASDSGTDALTKIGGGFVFNDEHSDANRRIISGITNCEDYLKQLNQKKDGASWQ